MAVVLSKLFSEGIRKRQCYNDLVHPDGCMINAVLNTYKFCLSNLKYFAPVMAIPLAVKIRNLNADVLKDALKYYVEAVLTGTATGWSISVMICVFRHLCGEFKYCTFLFLPSVIGSGLVQFFMPLRCQRLFQVPVFQCVIESLLLHRKNIVIRTIMDSTFLQTWIFMCCSALVLYAKQNKIYNGFWLLQPNPKRAEQKANEEISQEPNVCSHENQSCQAYLLRGLRTYVTIGATLDIAKRLLSPVASDGRGFFEKLVAKFGNLNLRTAAMLGTYVGIYRLLHCFLNRQTGKDADLNHIIAAFLSGSCFMFYPKNTLFSYGIVLSIQVLWSILKKQNQFSERTKLVLNTHIPFAKILYPLAIGYLVHEFALRRPYISDLGDTMINKITNNYANKILLNLQDIKKVIASK